MESVLVFTFISVFLDVRTPGGAFVWPSRDGEPAHVTPIVDELFRSPNVNPPTDPSVRR